MTAKAKRVLAELAELSPSDLEELLREPQAALGPFYAAVKRAFTLSPEAAEAFFQAMSSLNERGRARFHTGDLALLFKNTVPDPDFADDIEAGVRARREADESRTSPWET